MARGGRCPWCCWRCPWCCRRRARSPLARRRARGRETFGGACLLEGVHTPAPWDCRETLFLRGVVGKCHGSGSILPCCCKDSSLSRQVFLADVFYTRAKLHAEPWGYIVTPTPSCLRLQGTFLMLSFSRTQHSICRCFWELILTVCSSFGHILVLHSTSDISSGLLGKGAMPVFLVGMGTVPSHGYANLPSCFYILILPCKRNL